MKFILQTLFVLLFTLPLRAASIGGNSQLKLAESSFDDGVFKQEFGDMVKAACAPA